MAINTIISNYIDSLLSNTDREWFSPYVFGNPPTIGRKATCFAYPIDLSCAVVINGNWVYYSKMGGVAVTRKHILVAHHFNMGVGTTVYFIGTDNVVYSRTTTKFGYVTNADVTVTSTTQNYFNDRKTDAAILELSSDLPSAVTIAKVLPSNWATYISGGGVGLPLITSVNRDRGDGTRYKRVVVGNVSNLDSANTAIVTNPVFGTRATFWESWLGYPDEDSGTGLFMAMPGQTVVLGAAHQASANNGYVPAIHSTAIRADITSVLSAMGGGYSLTDADLARYEDDVLSSGFFIK